MLKRFMFLAIAFPLAVYAAPLALAQADCDFSFSNYARAVQLHDMGDYERALAHYRCAQLEDPDDAILPILIENVYEDIADASSAWSRAATPAKAVVCDPALDHALLGRQAHEAGDDVRAQILLECALMADPQNNDALYRMGHIYLSQADTHAAVNYFNRIQHGKEAKSADEDLLIALLGEDARQILDEDAARRLTLTSPDPAETGEYLPPGSDDLRTVLVVIWTNRRALKVDWREAARSSPIEKLQAALEREPTRVDLRCQLARMHYDRGDYAAAYYHYSYLIRETLGDHC
ncbi:MAG: hypothetical protein OXG85_00640 [Chloroflexi bacterium]|nr:hypothetical protein [Chloroflexota bacterium]